jgi:hypothetical protein
MLRGSRSIALALITALLVGSCGERPMPAASIVATPAPSILLSDLNAWVSFRLVYGLRADVEWVVAVASDPNAVTDFGPPLLSHEVQQVLDAQAGASALLPLARRYAGRYQADFVGIWIEGPVVVLGFADHVAERRAEVASLFGDKVAVREVRYSRSELQGFLDAVDRERGPNADACDTISDDNPLVTAQCDVDGIDWFETIGVEVSGVYIDEVANQVEIRYHALTKAVETAMRLHLGAGDWLRFYWHGPVREETTE